MGGLPAEGISNKVVFLALLALGCVSSVELRGSERELGDAADEAALKRDVAELRQEVRELQKTLKLHVPAAPQATANLMPIEKLAMRSFPYLFNCSDPLADEVNVTLGPLFCLQQNLGEGATSLLLPILTNRWVCLFAATAMCWQHHFSTFRRVRALGKAIVILNLYYAGSFGATATNASPHAFVSAVLYLLFEEIIATCVWKGILNCWRTRSAESRRTQSAESPGGQGYTFLERMYSHDDAGENYDVAFNVYMDFRKALPTALWMFVAQAGLIVYYIVELNGGSAERDSPGRDAHLLEKLSVTKWFTAVAIIGNMGHDQNGSPFHFRFWRNQYRKVSREHGLCECTASQQCRQDKSCLLPGASPARHVALRSCLDFVVNQCGRSVIRGTAPLMLAVEGPLDFVKDATAVFFVIALDDIQGVDLADPQSWRARPEGGADEIESKDNPNYRIEGLRELLFPASLRSGVDFRRSDAQELENLAGPPEERRAL